MKGRSPVAPPPAVNEPLFLAIQQLRDELERLYLQVDAEVLSTLQTQELNTVQLGIECRALHRDFQKLSQSVFSLKEPVEQKTKMATQKRSFAFAAPIEASKFQTIMMLHLVGEQGMSKRLEELRALDKRGKDTHVHYETAWNGLKERFETVVHRLNLLLYMQECAEKEGKLPANIMYMAKVPVFVSSPFAPRDVATKLKAAAPIIAPSQDKKEEMMKELERRRELIMELRRQAKQQPS